MLNTIVNALRARYESELVNRNNVATADVKALLNIARKFESNKDTAEKGLRDLLNCSKFDLETIARNIAVTDKRAKGFMSLKGIKKVEGLVLALGTRNCDYLDAHLGNFVSCVVGQPVFGEYTIFKRAVVGMQASQADLRKFLGYRGADNPEDMDVLISLGRADYQHSTVITQHSQIKCMLIAFGLADGVKGDKLGLTINGKFARKLNGLKETMHYNAESKGYNGPINEYAY